MFVEDFEALERTTKRSEKEKILKGAGEDTWVLLHYALDPYIMFRVKKLPEVIVGQEFMKAKGNDALGFFYQLLEDLAESRLTGNAAKDAVLEVLSLMDEPERKWLSRILLKNPRIGVEAKTLNKVRPGWVRTFEVMLAEELEVDRREGKVIEKLRYPVYCDLKLDGIRTIAIKRNGVCTLFSRAGHEIDTLSHVVKAVEDLPFDNIVFDGEAQGVDWNQTQSILSSTKNTKDGSLIGYNIFDVIDLKEWDTHKTTVPHCERMGALLRWERYMVNPLCVVQGRWCDDEAAVWNYLSDAIAAGYEGVMIKDSASPYPFKRSKACMKLKTKTTVEGVIIGWEPGATNSKWAGKFGAFRVQLKPGSEDERSVVSVGGGYTDAEREEFFNAEDGPIHYRGTIMEIECQEVTKDGKLRFPVFKRFRHPSDKS